MDNADRLTDAARDQFVVLSEARSENNEQSIQTTYFSTHGVSPRPITFLYRDERTLNDKRKI